jgi:tetratricopeptide (TPR) repeat protein
VADRLRPLWDFGDLDASEERLRAQLAKEPTDEGRAEVLTQLARVEGLRGDFEAGKRLVSEAKSVGGDSTLAAVRIDLERGRILRSSGDREGALPLFEAAFAKAVDAQLAWLAADAAHMAALAAPDREGFAEWTQRGIARAEEHEDASYWAGPLLNNLGWDHYEAEEYELALDSFERALRARQRDPENRDGVELAQYAVGKALRALGRSGEAIPLLEEAVASATERGAPDGWYHEELAEQYAAVGRHADAAAQASLAQPLLLEADPSLAEDDERRARLEALASAT